MRFFEILDQLTPIIGNPVTIRRTPNALTNEVFKLESSNGVWALRQNSHQSVLLGINREREAAVLEAVRNKPWAIHPVSFQNEYLLSLWQSGQTIEVDKQNLDALFSLLVELHQTEIHSDTLINKPLWIDEQIKILMGHAQQNQILPAFRKSANEFCERYQHPESGVLCHHDWHKGNLIMNKGRLTLLDWEYAAVGDPNVDIVAFMLGFQLTEDDTARLTERLMADKKTLENVLPLVTAMSLLWYMVRYPNKQWHQEQRDWLHDYGK